MVLTKREVQKGKRTKIISKLLYRKGRFANKCATQAVSQKGVVSLSKLQTFSGGKPIWLN